MLTLVIGSRSCSSSSLRPWLLMRERAIPFEELLIPLHRPDSDARKRDRSPSGKLPVLIDGERRIWESLAIVEYLAERFPEWALWPRDPGARAHARSVVCELLTGFERLWASMPFDCRAEPGALVPRVEADREVARVQEIWRDCRASHARKGSFLFGGFGAADAFFAQAVLRFRSYGVPLEGVSRAYAKSVLALGAMTEWLDGARAEPAQDPVP